VLDNPNGGSGIFVSFTAQNNALPKGSPVDIEYVPTFLTDYTRPLLKSEQN